MNWVIESWRIKLLALGLSVLMLGAVAFSQNPPTFKTLTITSFVYKIPSNLIVINPPTKTAVRVTGLADIIQSISANSLVATLDLSKAKPGPAVKVNLTITSPDSRVTVQNPSVPVALNIDLRQTSNVQVIVRSPHVDPGWLVTKADAKCPGTPCMVNFDGPASWQTDSRGQPNLKAYADFTSTVQLESQEGFGVPVDLEQSGTPLDPANFLKTFPNSSLDVTKVTVQIEAKTGLTLKQVVLVDAPPSHGPPTGYRITAITVDPISVLMSGKAAVMVKLTSLTLPAVDLSGHTSDFTFRITIPYPVGVTGPIPNARVTYSISANPNVQPAP